MLDFGNFQITKTPVVKVEKTITGRFIIGCDPFDIEENGLHVYKVFDKFNNTFTARAVTSATFDEFVKFYLAKEADKKLHVVSYKFIDGRTNKPKSIEQLRTESNRVTV